MRTPLHALTSTAARSAGVGMASATARTWAGANTLKRVGSYLTLGRGTAAALAGLSRTTPWRRSTRRGRAATGRSASPSARGQVALGLRGQAGQHAARLGLDTLLHEAVQPWQPERRRESLNRSAESE